MRKIFNRKLKFLLSFIITIIILNIILKIELPFEIQQNNDWIGFYGSIIGGMITLIGVYITIDYYRKEDKENKRLQIIPYFKMSDSEKVNECINTLFYESIDDDGEYIIGSHCFTLENIGLGSAVNVEFIKLYLFTGIQSIPRLSFRPGDSYEFNNILTYRKKISGNTLWFSIKFSDLLGNKYIQTFSLRYTYNSEEKKYYIHYDNNQEHKLIK